MGAIEGADMEGTKTTKKDVHAAYPIHKDLERALRCGARLLAWYIFSFVPCFFYRALPPASQVFFHTLPPLTSHTPFALP